jgi:2-oxoglutarate ferredoxin oxidoreductase subunit alpha
VIFLMDEIVGHMRERVEIPAPGSFELVSRRVAGNDGAYKFAYRVPEGKWVPGLKPFGAGERYNMTGLIHDYSGFPTNSTDMAQELVTRLLEKVEQNRADIDQVQEYAMEDAEYAVVCFGGTTRAVMSAVQDARAQGLRVGMWRPVTVWPFPEEELRARLPRLRGLLMVEHNYGQMLREVQRTAAGACPIDFIGCVNGTVIPPQRILAKIEEAFDHAQ